MVLCRFYQQGTCRFGNNCKFDHQLPGDNRFVNSTSILLRNVQPQQPTSVFQQQQQPSVFQQQQQPSVFQQQQQPSAFQQQQQPQQSSVFQQQQAQQSSLFQQQQQAPLQQQQQNTNIDVNILIKSVVNDMLTAEKGGQWLLSSYAPFKEKPPYPGFIDYSMEEIRYMFYEAVKKNTLQQYKYNLQLLLQQAIMKIKTLQNPTQDIINTLKQIYNSQQSHNNENSTKTVFQQNTVGKEMQQQQQQQFFNSNMTTVNPQQSIFSGQQQPQFLFNQQQQQPNITQQQANIFQQNFKGGFINSDATNPTQQQQQPQQPTSFFNQTNTGTKYNQEFYSKLDELTDDEKNWFNNNDIDDDLDKIPEKPPTYEMCF